MKWTYEFDETGGYDCMTGAFIIRHGTQTVATIDLNDFGQPHCDYSFKSERAEQLTKGIVEALQFVRDLAGPDSCFVTASVRERAQEILAKLDEDE